MPGDSLRLHVYLLSIPFRHLSELCWTEARRCPLPAGEAKYTKMIWDDTCNDRVSFKWHADVMNWNNLAYQILYWPKNAKSMSRTFRYFQAVGEQLVGNLLARLRSSLMALVCNLDQIGCSHHLVPINSKDMYMSPPSSVATSASAFGGLTAKKTTTEAQPQIRAIHYPQKITHLYTILVSTSTDQATSHFVACPCLPFAICILPSLSLG